MQLKFLTSGKVKDVYELEDGKLLFKFSNRVSAYDVKFKDEIPKKGEVPLQNLLNIGLTNLVCPVILRKEDQIQKLW